MNKINQFFDKPIAFHRIFVEITGSVLGGLLLSQAVYWNKRSTRSDGWWWKTQKEWEIETGMTRRELDTARKSASKFLLCERRGVPAKCFYSLDQQAMWEALANGQSSLAFSAKLDCPIKPNKTGVKSQSTNKTETTSETSTEIGATALAIESENKKFIRLWEEAYQTKFGIPYKFNGGRDAKAVKELLVADATADLLISIVKRAWKQNGFYASKLTSIVWLNDHWNDIQAEINKSGNQPPSERNFDDWDAAVLKYAPQNVKPPTSTT